MALRALLFLSLSFFFISLCGRVDGIEGVIGGNDICVVYVTEIVDEE